MSQGDYREIITYGGKRIICWKNRYGISQLVYSDSEVTSWDDAAPTSAEAHETSTETPEKPTR